VSRYTPMWEVDYKDFKTLQDVVRKEKLVVASELQQRMYLIDIYVT